MMIIQAVEGTAALPAASAVLETGFTVLGVTLAAAFVAAVRAVAGGRAALVAGAFTVVWLGGTLAAAAAGRLQFGPVPPPMLFVVVALIAIAVGVGRSRLGERLATGLPLALLVGFQGFRLPLELLMHRAYAEGLMPVQMSYSGWNFDIVTGATALVVAGLVAAGVGGIRLVRAWNWLGTLLLLNIMAIALLSMPIPLQLFSAPNVWVTQAPFVWLPAVLVLAALLGHILLFRRLRREVAPAARPVAAPAARAGAGTGV